MTYCLTPQEFPFSSASPPPPPHTKGGRCGGGRGEVGRLSEPYGLTQSRVVVSVVSLASLAPPLFIIWGGYLLGSFIKRGQGLGLGRRGRQRLTKPTTTFPLPFFARNKVQPLLRRGCKIKS